MPVTQKEILELTILLLPVMCDLIDGLDSDHTYRGSSDNPHAPE